MTRGGEEGLVLRKNILEKGFVLEGPRGFVSQDPKVVVLHSLHSPIEVRPVVGAKAELASRQGARVKQIQKGWLYESPFEVALFRPRVGKQDDDAVESQRLGHGFKKLHCFGLEEEKRREVSFATFVFSLLNSLGHEVETDASFLGMGLGVGGEPVSVSATNFQGEPAAAGLFSNFRKARLAESPDTISALLGRAILFAKGVAHSPTLPFRFAKSVFPREVNQEDAEVGRINPRNATGLGQGGGPDG